MENYPLLEKLLVKLNDLRILENFIIIGSWAQYFYSIYYRDTTDFPMLRTQDVDLLIHRPMNQMDINLPDILSKELDFIKTFDTESGLMKLQHPDFELEFLISEKGRGTTRPENIASLHLNALPLRYLYILESNVLTFEYKGLKIQLPIPAAFIIQKILILPKRQNDKFEKDISTIISISGFLLRDASQRNDLKKIMKELPKKTQKDVILILRKFHSRYENELFGLLKFLENCK
ncbi:MAG: hypothetical protein HPY53_08050 [Brevinematales bacterium]|nr:hypothetical protein [Brevinematales bacterium]